MAYQFKPVLVCSACWTMHAVWETRRANGRANSRDLFAGWWFGESYRILDPSGTTVNLDTARQCVGPCCPGCGAEPVVLRRARARFMEPSIWNLWRPPASVIREGEETQGAVSVVTESPAELSKPKEI